MAAESFEKDSLDWQIQQFRQRLGEWLELKFPRSEADRAPDFPGWFPPDRWLETTFWILVIALGIWLSWLLYRWLSPYLSALRSRHRLSTSRPSSALPEERSAREWLQQAQRFQQQQNYSAACQALYSAMLHRLHETQQLPHQASRSDGEYWQAVRSSPQANAYQVLLSTHEQLCFGSPVASIATWDRCRAAYQAIAREDID